MKRCPFCGEENLDQAVTCYFCGNHLPAQAENDVEPTQPNRVQRRSEPGQPAHGAPQQGSTEPYQPYQPYPPYQSNLPPDYTQPGGYDTPYAQSYPQPPSQSGYTQAYPAQPPYQQPPSYQQPGYPADYYAQQGGYPPGAYPPGAYAPEPPKPQRSRLGIILPVFLGMILLCVCLVAVWAVLDTTNRGMARLGDQISTRAADLFGGAAGEAAPTATEAPEEPSPWPTFTPEAGAPEPTVPGPGSVYAEKLLSPECRASLDHLSGLTTQLSQEPLKLLEETWRDEFNQARQSLKTYCGTLDSASPVPGRVEAAHTALAQADTEYELANQLVQEAIDGRDPGKILEAAGHFAEAAKNLNTALAEIRKVVE